MITGSNSIKARGYTRYYYCWTYHRKGSVSCKRNASPKDRLETKVLDVFINELNQLMVPGALETEIERYSEMTNKTPMEQIGELAGAVKYVDRRIRSLKEIPSEAPKAQNIAEMEGKKDHLEKQLNELKQKLTKIEMAPEDLEAIRDRLKDTTARIKIEPPDIQWLIMKRFIAFIRLDKESDTYKMMMVVRKTADEISESVLLERLCYFADPRAGKQASTASPTS